MNKISNNTRNAEMYAVIERIATAYNESGITEDIGLMNIFSQIDPKLGALKQAIMRMKAESELEEADELRDNDYNALYNFVYGATFHPDSSIKSSAEKVFACLQHYGRAVTQESYDTQTSHMDSLFEDLNKREVKEAVDIVTGCSELIEKSQNSQNAFKLSRKTFQDEQALEAQQESASEIKKQLHGIINKKLVPYLNGMMVANGITYGKLNAKITQIINDNNEIVKRRSTQKNAA
ncbi:hypothetical protein E9993_18990 [Labilibacter sediminis]|nr:hypothetical protein E9993_18990 [Labilibacter sediminis]